MNKIIIGILVFLLVASGGVGFYLFDLNKQIGTLSDELTTFRGETGDQISAQSDELTTLRGETATQIGTLSDELTIFRGETGDQISSLGDDLTTFRGETASQIGTLRNEVTTLPVINVSELYEKIKESVVEVFVEKEMLGSGFVFDADGHIITNYHVVEEATEIDVVLYDGTIFEVSVIGSSKLNDIAVLKLEEELGLEPLKLADSDDVATGDPVMVIGNPFGLTRTVASGIINQEARFLIPGLENYMVANLIQYSAASYPGNSGGPLLNSRGEVIGLVTARFLVAEEINYAVSSNKVSRVARSIIDNGSFDNPTLPGTWELKNLTVEEARVKKLETTGGVSVTEADATSIFEADDIIVAIDGLTVRSGADLFNYLGEHKSPGDTVTLTVIRREAELQISIELVEGGVLSG